MSGARPRSNARNRRTSPFSSISARCGATGVTYFPPRDYQGRPGFRRVLLAVADSYRQRRAELERAANSLSEAVGQAEAFTGARAEFDTGVVDAQIESITQLFDGKNGGFGRAPKFPHASAIDLLLERYQQSKEKQLPAMVEATLEKMARGGVSLPQLDSSRCAEQYYPRS